MTSDKPTGDAFIVNDPTEDAFYDPGEEETREAPAAEGSGDELDISIHSNLTELYDNQTAASLSSFSERVAPIVQKHSEDIEDKGSEDIKQEKEKRYHNPLKDYIEPIIVGIYFGACLLYLIRSIVSYSMALAAGDPSLYQPSYMQVVGVIVSLGVFMLSTWCRTWNYEIQKKILISLIIAQCGDFILRFSYAALFVIFTPLLSDIANGGAVSSDKWSFIVRTFSFFFPTFFSFLAVNGIRKILFEEYTLAQIQRFRLREHIDIRHNRRYLYDIVSLKNMKDGLRYSVNEADRFYHLLTVGASGTGKTNLIVMPVLLHDLIIRKRNKNKLKKELIKGLKKKQYYMLRPVTDEDFHPSAFAPYPEYKAKYDKLVHKYRMAGIMYMAPDSSSIDQFAKLVRAQKERVYLVDPEPKPGTPGLPKDGFIALNPLALPDDTPEWRRVSDIVVRATIFSTVLQKIFNSSGKTDPYFESVNKTVTVAFAITLQATFPILKHRQPNATDLQNFMNSNNFSDVSLYYPTLKKINDELPQKDYQFVVDFLSAITADEKHVLYERSGGLRLIFSQFLANPLIRRTLCPAQDAPSLDLDKAMREGGLIAVNFSQINDPTYGFGLFVLLYTIDAVFRRDGSSSSTEAPFFITVDEAARLATSRLDEAFTQGRKFRTSFNLCLQTLDQMLKDDTTKYLKGVLQQAAHHFLFGRCSGSEIETYTKLCGRQFTTMQQESVTQTSITDAAPSYSYSTRSSVTPQDVVQGYELRNMPFQEITFLTAQNGSPAGPFHCRVDFISKTAYNTIREKATDWEGLYSAYGIPDTTVPSGRVVRTVDKAMPVTPSGNRNHFTDDGTYGSDEETGSESSVSADDQQDKE